MSYTNITDVFGLESIGAGQFISESAEERTFNIIENHLIGAISAHSGGHGVLKLGDFVTAGDSGGFTINLNPSGGTPAAQGFMRFIHFKTNSTIQWIIDSGDGTYYLYVQRIETATQSTAQFGDVTAGVSLSSTIPDDALLIAEATVVGNIITLDSAPTDRLDISTIADHIANNTNPHTAMLLQDQLFASGITAQTAEFAEMKVMNELKVSGLAIFQGPAGFLQDVTIEGNVLVSGSAIFIGDAILSGTSFIQDFTAAHVNITSGALFRPEIIFHNHIRFDSGVTIDGRDISLDGTVLDNHVSGLPAFLNPHNVTAAQVSGIPVTGSGPSLQGNLTVNSGVTVDGINLKTAKRLLAGGNADDLHTHDMSGIQVNTIAVSAEYCGTVFSGAGVFDLTTEYDPTNDKNFYNFVPASSGKQCLTLVKRQGVPADFKQWTNSGLQLWNGVSAPADTDTYVELSVKDTAGTLFGISGGQLQRNILEQSVLDLTPLNVGTFESGKSFTLFMQVCCNSGVAATASVSDLTFQYDTVFTP